MTDLRIDIERASGELERLAGFSDAEPPSVTRVLFSECDLEAREYLVGLFKDAGLQVRVDAAGNIFARWLGRDVDLPAVATGSHCDAIPHSGRYDGTVGVLGGLEAIRSLQQIGFEPERSIELIMFTAEEPTRYGVGCLGSRLLSGVMAPAAAEGMVDAEGRSFQQLRNQAGCKEELSTCRRQPGDWHCFVELHIEQGPLLDRDNVPIGVVTAIAAPAALRVTYLGEGGHAGAVLMPDRRDALLAASELAVAVERVALELGGDDTVATTGVLQVHPGAVNSIPSRCYLEIDIRDIELERRDRVLNETQQQATEIGEKRRQETKLELINADPPATCGAEIVEAIEQSVHESGLTFQKMISRAYHDSLFMALLCPTAMIFIPCRDGVSHRPDEYTTSEAITNGVSVLARALRRLAAV